MKKLKSNSPHNRINFSRDIINLDNKEFKIHKEAILTLNIYPKWIKNKFIKGLGKKQIYRNK